MSETTEKPAVVQEALETHSLPVTRWPGEYPREMGRFANMTRMVFHPTDANPTGPNAGIPPHGLAYIHGDDVDAAVAKTQELGGSVKALATRRAFGVSPSWPIPAARWWLS